MNEEGYIRSRIGNGNPFRVPEGYFDGFASQMMDKLPERDAVVIPMHRSRMSRLRAVMCTAACLLAAVFGATFWFNGAGGMSDKHSDDVVASNCQTFGSDTYEEEFADYVMMDNTDIYAYLADE